MRESISMSLLSTKRVNEEVEKETESVPESPKRHKVHDDDDDDDDNDAKKESEKVGATELASAMALASLASFSPKTDPNKDANTPSSSISATTTKTSPPETRDTEHTEEGSITSWEPKVTSSPSNKEDPTPITPETRFPDTNREKRVSFAPGLKDNERKDGTSRRLSFTPRFVSALSRMPPGFSRAGGAFGPPRMSSHHHHHGGGMLPPWVRHHQSSMMPPSPGGGYMPPPPPRAMVMQHHAHPGHPHHQPQQQQQQQQLHLSPPYPHHHPHHSPTVVYHSPPGAMGASAAAAAAAASNQWICDYCNAASFASYEEACYHEEICRRRATISHHHHYHQPGSAYMRNHHQQPPFLPGMQQLSPSSSRSGMTASTASSTSSSEGKLGRSLPAALAVPSVAPEHIDDDRPPATGRDWCKGTMKLAIPEFDKEWLSEINCFIRDECVEAFSATEEDIKKSSKRGRVTADQVGIRCCFCKHVPLSSRTAAAVSYPTSVAGIYESVKRWQRVHMSLCEEVPQDVKNKVEELGNGNAWVATTRQYWADSARALGMVDTLDGIRFGTDPSNGADTTQLKAALSNKDKDKMKEGGEKVGDGDPIVFQEDVSMVPPYVYFLMRQVESCHFTEADRFVARSKGPVGYPGFQCRHCNGHAGLGKYFPVSSKSLATNSTSQNIHAHLLKCRKTPSDVKGQLMALKDEKTRAPRLEPGWRKVFFDQVWARLHGTEPE